MSKVAITDTLLNNLSDSIADKADISTSLTIAEMKTAIENRIQKRSVTKKIINFIDYDGTILYSYNSLGWSNLNGLPPLPTHDGLTCQGWNWTKAQIDARIARLTTSGADDDTIFVGPMYTTASGKTEIDIEISGQYRTSPYFSCAVNGSISIDWGDGSTATTLTGSSLTTIVSAQHSYSPYKKYTIKITVNSGSWAFYSNGTLTLLNKNSNLDENQVYANYVRAVRIGPNTSIGAYAFYCCESLEYVTIPNSITGNISSSTSCFRACFALRSLTLPSGITGVPESMFRTTYSLLSVSLPESITSISNYMFYSAAALIGITIPSSVTSIGQQAFQACYSLETINISSSGITSIGVQAFQSCQGLDCIRIPSTVTSIGNNAFKNCNGMARYYVAPSSPPTLGTTAFDGIASDTNIIVNYNLGNTYKSASGWSTYSSYITEMYFN